MTELRTDSGRTVVVTEANYYRDWRFIIDGQEAVVSQAHLYRDGGTRRYVTDRGTVVFPHRLGSEDRTPRLDGEALREEDEVEEDGPKTDRLVALRHAMQGAEVPSVLLTWMQEVEERLADLRNREIASIRGCLGGASQPAARGVRIGYDPDRGDPLYNRDQQVTRVIRDNECPASVPPPGMVSPGVPLKVEQRRDEWLSIKTPDRVFEGYVLFVEEVPHPVNGDDHVTFRLPVPHGLPCSRAAVMLVALDDPVLPTMDEASAVRFEDDYPEEGET